MHEEAFYLFFVIFCTATRGAPPVSYSTPENILEVPLGKKAVLSCESNDENHNFLFWELARNGSTIGPGNESPDSKYDYEVLSGNLIIKRVSTNEEGLYKCVSMGVRDDTIKIRAVRMIIKRDWKEVYESDPSVNFFRVIIVLGTIFITFGGGYLYYRKWRGEHRLQSILEEEDEDDSAEEIFTAPSTSKGTGNIIREGKGSERLLDDFDNSLNTDLGGILNQGRK